jgi:hypothetical protein
MLLVTKGKKYTYAGLKIFNLKDRSDPEGSVKNFYGPKQIRIRNTVPYITVSTKSS